MDYQFNREVITPSYVKCNRTPSSRSEIADKLAKALAGCKIKPAVVAGFSGVAPRPARSDRVDPETVLKRKSISVPASVARDFEVARREHDAQMRIREMADSMEGKQ